MTLLESIIRAAGDNHLISSPQSDNNCPIVLNPDDIIPHLKPTTEPPSPISLLLNRVSGWQISPFDTDVIQSATRFAETLTPKLKNPRSLKKADFLALLNTFLRSNAEKIRFSLNPGMSDVDFACLGIEKLGFLIGREVAGLIAEGCVVLGLWQILETLIVNRLAGHLSSVNLVDKLVEKKQSELLCLFAKHISDLRSDEMLALLKYFLSPLDDCYGSMVEVRKKWGNQALLTVEKAAQSGLPKKVSVLAREASVLMMMAHDGFSSSELCLHYLFGSSNVDGLVLSSAVSRLDGSEVLGLIRYFIKWLEKYEEFPEARPCPSAGSVLGLRECDSVPSLESVVRALGLVLDEHFSYLVLNSEFHKEVKAAEKVVSSLASEVDLCCPVNEVIKHLQTEASRKGVLLQVVEMACQVDFLAVQIIAS
ncbi:uncharacterized protein [Typha angustifolia]|uniref:uncharacterized protein isoform X2 n=1 Tax=Typha angustifolia TaxID=59011 RepID=UPI003C2DC48B